MHFTEIQSGINFMKIVSMFFSLFIIILCLKNHSFAGEKYYNNIRSNIEFRAIALENSKIPTVELRDTEGNIHRVEKTIMLYSSDVIGISTDENQITFLFNPKSWGKVREVSQSLYKRKLAIIKNGIIFFAPTIASTISRSAKLSQSKKVSIQPLMDGFVPARKPQSIGSEEDYIQFLKTWLANHPNDKEVLTDLVFAYIPENDYSKCEDAIVYLERILEGEPSDYIIGYKLLNCFNKTNNFEKALKVSEDLLPHLSEDFMKYLLVGAIGQFYYRLGMLEKAIQHTELALNYFKTAKSPVPPDLESYHPYLKEQAKQSIHEFESHKKEAVLVYEKTLVQYRKELQKQ